MPQNLEAERLVLGGVLLEFRHLYTLLEMGLRAEDFYQEAHQKIFQTIFDLYSRSQAIDAVTVNNALQGQGILDRVGGAKYIADLIDTGYALANVEAWAQIVRDKASERRIITVCSELMSEALDGVVDHLGFKERVEREVLGATSERRTSTFSSLGDTLQDVMNHLQSTAERKSAVIGVPSGFRDLDKETMGWHPGQLVIVAARPGMGKTSLMLNVALNAALQGDIPVAVFSMEMTKLELAMRLLSMEAKVDSNRLKNASRLTDQDWRNIQRAGSVIDNAQIFLDDSPNLSILELKSRARRVQTQKGLGLVIVDYLQLMRGLGGSRGSYNREQEIAEISRGLKSMAKELGVPVIAASQLSREVERRENRKPQLSDLRESGAIEQDADIVIFIHREKDNPELAHEADLIMSKHRSGSTGEVKVAWLGQYTTFKDYAHGGDPAGASPNF
jgi:replicative DNA helicase